MAPSRPAGPALAPSPSKAALHSPRRKPAGALRPGFAGENGLSSSALRILFVEDDVNDEILLKRALTAGGLEFEALRVEDERGLEQGLAGFRPDLVLSDYTLRGTDGLRVLHLARETAPDVPFILVTGSLSEEVAVECLKAGAADYILKDRLKRLPAAVTGALARARDQKARREAEESIRASEERYRTLFEANPFPTWVVDEETHRFLAVNERAVRHYGYSRAEFAALTLFDVRPPEELARLREHLAEHKGRPDFSSWRHRRRDGSLIDVEATSHPFSYLGRAARLSVVIDVTERRQLEQAVRRSERMSAMGALVAGVAHEVRNPLFSIAANLDALESRRSLEDLQKTLPLLRREVDRVAALMRDLLDYGRPGKLDLRPWAPQTMVAEAVEASEGLARERGVELLSAVPADLPRLHVDRQRIFQVLQNLLDNALRHSPTGAAVSIRGESAGPSAAPAVSFAVEDAGPGFPLEDLPRLFEPFFTRRRGGTGLGLSIVQRFVEDHGGRVQASNRPEGGARLTVTLPVGEPPPAPEAAP